MPVRLAAILALFAAGCSFAAADAVMTENRCTSDRDCAGAICDVAAGLCVALPDEPLRIAIEVTPASDPGGGTPTTHTYGPVLIDGPAQQDLTLHPSINVFGTLRSNLIAGPVEATVRFERGAEFAGAPSISKETTTLASPVVAADGNQADYAVRVLQNRTYDVTVTPIGESVAVVPPLRVTGVMVAGGGDFARLNIEYPELQPLRGVIVGPDEVSVPRLQVQAVRPDTGTVVSSTAVTDEFGEFTIYMPPDAGEWVFRISGGPDRAVYPTLLADPGYFFPDDTGYVRILVPMLNRILYRGRVVPKNVPTGAGVADAVLSFRSVDVFDDATGVTGSFRITTTSDSTGVFVTEILPGTYDVVVTPPAELTPGSVSSTPSDLGVLVEEALEIRRPPDGTGELVGQTFEVPTRATVGGQVLTTDGRGVTGATVQAIALGRPGATPAARHNRSADDTTDATGQFTMRLDFGAYDLAIKPATESGFSWLVIPGVSFATTEPFTPTYELAAPVPVSGTVVSPDDTAPIVAGAEVRAWALIDEDGTTRAVQIGRTMTREDGTYTLLLPSRL